jgi:hypothetical protein
MHRTALRRGDHVRRTNTQVNSGRLQCQRPTQTRAVSRDRLVVRWTTSWDGQLVSGWSLERSQPVRTTTSEDVMSDSDEGRSPRTGARSRPPVVA